MIGPTQTDRKGDRVHIDQHNVPNEVGDNFPSTGDGRKIPLICSNIINASLTYKCSLKKIPETLTIVGEWAELQVHSKEDPCNL